MLTRLRSRLPGSDDAGIVAIWTAILMVVFLGMAAIAVDISRWYVEIERVQKTVDAAALAGAVHMPGSLAKAEATANEMVAANGWDLSAVGVTSEQGERPSQLRVTMSSTVPNPFGVVLGVPDTTITRTAVGEFASPVPMGSPCNIFGNESMESGQPWSQGQVRSADCAGTGQYWVNMAGENVNKARGDGYAASWCTRPDDGVGIDNCDPDRRWTSGSPYDNADYTPDGYVYIVRTKSAGALRLEGYDIGWAATGDRCTDNFGLNNGPRPTNPFVTTPAEANERYARANNAYCAGDSSMAFPEGDHSTVRTVVTVREPSPEPWNPLAGTVRCTLDLPGWDRNTPSSQLAAGGDPLLQEMFHRWMNLCPGTLSVGANEDWSIQIQTFGGGGQNRYALRATLGGSGANVSIFANGKVSLYNNVNAGVSNFKVVRLDSSAAGHTLVVRFFDLGDATDPVVARVLQPDSARMGGVALNPNSPFPTCFGDGPTSGSLTNCQVTTRASTHGGRWQEIAIPIASDYECTDNTDQSKCWVRIRLTTASAQSDTTTWSAGLDGDPVRLVE